MKKNPYYTKQNENCIRCGSPLGRKNKYCGVCAKLVRKELDKQRHTKPLIVKVCPECLTEFAVSGNHGQKYCSRQCARRREARVYADKRRFYNKRRKHILRELEHNLTLEEWNGILEFFDGKCAYCGVGGTMDKEHVIPLSRGGGFTKENIVPACRECNQSKHDKTVEEWGVVPTKKFFEYFERV